jgi:hypothetical protein
MGKSVLLLLVLLMLLPASLSLADGQEKVAVCHLDDEGSLIPISVADPALDTHLTHGDGVVGEDYDENCEPLSVAETGCFEYTEGYYYPLNGDAVQFAGGEYLYTDDTCTMLSTTFLNSTFRFVWAESVQEAYELCPYYIYSGAVTPNL